MFLDYFTNLVIGNRQLQYRALFRWHSSRRRLQYNLTFYINLIYQPFHNNRRRQKAIQIYQNWGSTSVSVPEVKCLYFANYKNVKIRSPGLFLVLHSQIFSKYQFTGSWINQGYAYFLKVRETLIDQLQGKSFKNTLREFAFRLQLY